MFKKANFLTQSHKAKSIRDGHIAVKLCFLLQLIRHAHAMVVSHEN